MRILLLGIAVASGLAGAADADHDSRKLTAAEQRIFFPLVCSRPARHDKNANCAKVLGYSDDAPAVATDGAVSLDLAAIAYGAFSHAGADQAYVTYGASFEPHANNFGGGILFERQMAHWRLVRWYSGGQRDPCIALPAAGGVLKHLCLSYWTGSGETDASIRVDGLPSPDADAGTAMLAAQDVREAEMGDQSNYQCTLTRAPSEGILLSIDDLRRSRVPGVLAEAHVTYAAPHDVAAACRRNAFAKVRETHAVVRFVVRGNRVVALTPVRFAKTDHG
jgi:hypothetical protein